MLEMKHQENTSDAAGFTLIELLLAMAVFSFMLLIIVVGFMNIVRLHNQAVASNQAQDSARAAMDELVMAVRDSGGVSILPTGELCLAGTTGQPKQYYLSGSVLNRAGGCGPSKPNPQQVTSDVVRVSEFRPEIETSGAGVTKAQVKITLTVGSANGTTNVNPQTGKLECGPSQSDRTFCAIVTLTSQAVQR